MPFLKSCDSVGNIGYTLLSCFVSLKMNKPLLVLVCESTKLSWFSEYQWQDRRFEAVANSQLVFSD